MSDNNANAKPWFLKLHWQVLIALVAGMVFGWLAPVAAESIGFLGDIFLRLLKMIIIPLIFTLAAATRLPVLYLAIPAVAGPSSLAIAMLMVTRDPDRMLDWTIALVAAWAVVAVLLMASPLLLRALGNRGLIAMERLMGMILVIISVQMFFDGVQKFLNLGAVSG